MFDVTDAQRDTLRDVNAGDGHLSIDPATVDPDTRME